MNIIEEEKIELTFAQIKKAINKAESNAAYQSIEFFEIIFEELGFKD